MAAEVPEAFRDLVTAKRSFAVLATVGRDGAPHATPVWFDFHEGHFRVNSARGRVKDRNMRRNPVVSLVIMDPDNPYRYLAVRGRVVEITEQGADPHIDSLARKYLGQDGYPYRRPGEVRVLYRIAPERVTTMG